MTNISEENKNPLTASRYGDELADRLANLIISNASGATKEPMKSWILSEIDKAKMMGENARIEQRAGMMGPLLSVDESVNGFALLRNGILYLSSDFTVSPGPSLHLYLSQTIDPREGTFPDETAIDLGEIQTIYGAQTYRPTLQGEDKLYRTIALFDTTLNRLYGFGQLSQKQ
jgi:hypothetical protein